MRVRPYAILFHPPGLGAVLAVWNRVSLLSETSSNRALRDYYFDRCNSNLAHPLHSRALSGAKDWFTTVRALVWSRVNRRIHSRNRCGSTYRDANGVSVHPKAAVPEISLVNRRYHNYALFVRPTAGSTSDIAVFHQLGSGVPVNPFAKSELLY